MKRLFVWALVLSLAAGMVPAEALAKKGKFEGMVDHGDSTFPNGELPKATHKGAEYDQYLQYFSSTLYKYNVGGRNLAVNDYNQDTAEMAYQQDPDDPAWKGIYFNDGRPQETSYTVRPLDPITNMVGDPISVTKNFTDTNRWSGLSSVGGAEKSGYIRSGLVSNALVNGRLRFRVPAADPFTASVSNKKIYRYILMPYVYDSYSKYFALNTVENAQVTENGETRTLDAYDIHFDDLNDNGVIEDEECINNARLMLDKKMQWTSDSGGKVKGFFPFNCYNGNGTTNANPVYHFGMRTAIPFRMTENGKRVDGSGQEVPITFEFAGDDDVWVFIDGQLVLDLGGIHDSVSAKLDFATNTIEMWTSDTRKKSGDMNSDVSGLSEAQPGDTVVQGQIFNDDNGRGKIGKTLETFAAEGEHTMTFYYLERGKGASNAMIRFNFPKDDGINISKLVSMENKQAFTAEEQEAINDIEFQMRVREVATNEIVRGKYVLYRGSAYIGTYETGQGGWFTIKHGQRVRFACENGLSLGGYTIEERASEENLPAGTWTKADWLGSFVADKIGRQEGVAENAPGKNILSYTYIPQITVENQDLPKTLSVTCTNYVKRPFSTASDETVVLDYGLPALIDIMKNDMRFEEDSSSHEFRIAEVSGATQGTVEVVDAQGNPVDQATYQNTEGRYYLKYTPYTYLDKVEKIKYTYTVEQEGEIIHPSASAYVVPATVMYYEENFKKADGSNWINLTTDPKYAQFTPLGEDNGAFQEPGVAGDILDSVYGTDIGYLNQGGDSNGTSLLATTERIEGADRDTVKPAQFSYQFTGTGTAFFARTTKKSCYIRVRITDTAGNPVGGRNGNYYVDTKYRGEDDEVLYNIPVFNVEGLAYGTYTVTVTASAPSQWYAGQDQFYLDGVRVYRPLDMTQLYHSEAVNPDDEAAMENLERLRKAEKAYEDDMEADPAVITLRDYMLYTQVRENAGENDTDPEWNSADSWLGTGSDVSQVMFTDTVAEINNAAEYHSFGPKQEIYMQPGQKISFVLRGWFRDKPTGCRLVIGAKTPKSEQVTFTANQRTYKVKNTTDCYYDITPAVTAVESSPMDGYVTITATEGLLSLTNLKCTGYPGFSLSGLDESIDAGHDQTVIGWEGSGSLTNVYSFLRGKATEIVSEPETEQTTESESETEKAAESESESESETEKVAESESRPETPASESETEKMSETEKVEKPQQADQQKVPTADVGMPEPSKDETEKTAETEKKTEKKKNKNKKKNKKNKKNKNKKSKKKRKLSKKLKKRVLARMRKQLGKKRWKAFLRTCRQL